MVEMRTHLYQLVEFPAERRQRLTQRSVPRCGTAQRLGDLI